MFYSLNSPFGVAVRFSSLPALNLTAHSAWQIRLHRIGSVFRIGFALVVFVVAALLLTVRPAVAQTNGVWVSTATAGTWSTGLNWQGGFIARGAGATADFSQQAMTNNVLVHSDTARTVGALIFGDPGNTYNYTVDNNGNSNNTLTLSSSGGLIGAPFTGCPSIKVVNGTATISAIITGSGGLIVNPGGQTGTLVLTGANTFYDAPVQGTPPNGGYGAITVNGGLLSVASDVPTGTYLFETTFNGTINPSPLGALPPGVAGFPVSGASFEPADIWLSGGGLQATATFELSPFRGVALGLAAGGGGGTIDVTGGHVLTYGYDASINSVEGFTLGGVITDYNANTGSSLTLTGAGTLFLNGNNTYTGATNINGAGFTLELGIANAISRFSGVSVASTATFWLNGFSQSIGSLAGAGSVTNNASTGTNISLTIGSDNTSPTLSGVLSNTTGGNTDIIATLTKVGTGNQTFSTPNSASWPTTGNGGGYDLAGPASGTVPVVAIVGGAVTIDLSHAATLTNLVNPYYALQLGGGTIALVEPSGNNPTSQAFNGTTVNSGASAVVVTTNGNTGSTGFNLGAIARNAGGTADFTPGSASTGNIHTSNAATSFLGGWATVAGTDWAGINGSGNIVPLTSAGGTYSNDLWTGGNTTVTASSSPLSGSTTNSLRFNAAGPNSGGFVVTLAGGNTITSGGILVTPNAGANGATITGPGTLTSGNATDLIVQQYDTAGSLNISNAITGAIGLTKSGPGTLALTGASSYTGPTTINAGIVSITSDGVGNNAASPLGSTQSAATPGDIVIDGGTLQVGGTTGGSLTINSNRGVALGPTTGFGNGTINVVGLNTVTVGGIIANNGTSASSLTKTGPGTLILTGANTYTGGLYLNQGTVLLASSAAQGGSGGLDVFTGNTTLQYSGANIGLGNSHRIVITNGATATLDNNAGAGGTSRWLYAPSISGVGGLNFISSVGTIGASVVFDQSDIATNSTYTGPTTIYAGNYQMGWSLVNNEPQTTRLNPYNVLNLGGRIQITYSQLGGNTGQTDVLATFVNLIADTSSQFYGNTTGTIGGAGTVITLNSVNSNGIVRNSGSTLDVDLTTTLYVANGAVANTAGILGGWATLGGADWAIVGADNSIASYTGYVSNTWAVGNNTKVTANDDFSGTPNLTTNSLQFVSLIATTGSALSQTVKLSGTNAIASGGILVTINTNSTTTGTVNSAFAITGGNLTSSNGSDLIVNQFNALPGSSLTIASRIIDNGATSIGLTLGGSDLVAGGTLILTNSSNSYTGATVVNAATTLRAGANNVIPATSALIISKVGTLDLNAYNQNVGSLANFNNSVATLSGLNFGYGTTVVANGVVSLTVGNDNSSTSFNGALRNGSGVLSLVKVGNGTLTVGNFNDNIISGTLNLSDYTGGTSVNSGTLQAGAINTIPAASAMSIASGASFALGGYSQSIGSLTGAGNVTDNSSGNATLTVGNDNSTPIAFSGVLSNTTLATTGLLSLAKVGSGTFTLTTPFNQVLSGSGDYDTYSGPTVVAGGTLLLDFSNAASGPSNLVNSASVLTLAGGTLAIKDQTGSAATTQTFSSGTVVNAGASAISVNVNGSTNSSNTLALGAVSRNVGGTVDFGTLPATGNITTATANIAVSILGGWATFGGGSTWAVSGGNGVTPGSITGLSTYQSDNFASNANNVTVAANDSPGSPFTINSLRFNANSGASGYTVTLPAGTNTIASGGILVTPAAGAFASAIAGGTLRSGNSQDLIVQQYNSAGTLTIGSTIANGAAGPTSLTKSGPGALILSVSNSYTGGTFINAGSLTIQDNSALGGGSGGSVTVVSGAELDLAGSLFGVANPITMVGAGVSGSGALNNVGGSNVYSGPITLSGATTIGSTASGNTLTFSGAVNAPATASQITFVGSGNVAINGPVVLAAATTIASSAGSLTFAGPISNLANGPSNPLTFSGSGNIAISGVLGNTTAGVTYSGTSTLTFNGAVVNTYTGTTTVNSGTLLIDFSNLPATGSPATTANLINTSSKLVLGGGVFAINFQPGANVTTQTLSGVTINAGASAIVFNANGNAGVTIVNSDNSVSHYDSSVSLNGFTRNLGGTVNTTLPTIGSVTTTTANSNGILGGWATLGGTDWAANKADGSNIIIPLPTYTSDTWASGNNTTITLSAHTSDALTTNSLQFAAAAPDVVSLSSSSSAAPNIIGSGGILVSSAVGSNNNTISAGFLTSGNGSDLIVNQFASGSLTISSAIVDNGSPTGLTESGGGALVLSGANSYSGPTIVNAGTLQAGALNTIPATSGLRLAAGATFVLNGFSQSIGSLTGAGNVTDNSGTNVVLTVGNDNSSPPAFSGVLSNTTAATSGTVSLVKLGSGTLTLTGVNSYTGGTTITAGILDINADAALGATSANPNITFNGNVNGGGALQFAYPFSGTSLSSSRNMTVNSGAFGSVDTNGNPLITWGGMLTNSGTFSKIGAGTFEIDPLTLNSNSSLNVAAGTLRLNVATPSTVGTGVTAVVSSGATLELAGSVAALGTPAGISTGNLSNVVNNSVVGGTGGLHVTGPNQLAGTITGAGNTVVETGTSLTAYQIKQNSLTINGTGTVTLVPSGSGTTTIPAAPNNVNFSSNVASLSIGGTLNAWTGKLDIGNNGLVIQYGAGADPFTTITNMVKSGYANGNWTGTGITSSMARAAVVLGSPTPALNIGLIDFVPNGPGFGSSISFEGQTITTNAVLVRLTYMDDLVLSGDMAQANATSDALFFAANYGSGTVWHVGDITHDGVIDTNDALLFAANYVVGLPSLDGTTGNAAALGGNSAAVPEPSSLILFACGAAAVSWRVKVKRRARRLAEIAAS